MGETPCPVELGGQKYAHISVASAIVQNQPENIGYLRKNPISCDPCLECVF